MFYTPPVCLPAHLTLGSSLRGFLIQTRARHEQRGRERERAGPPHPPPTHTRRFKFSPSFLWHIRIAISSDLTTTDRRTDSPTRRPTTGGRPLIPEREQCVIITRSRRRASEPRSGSVLDHFSAASGQSEHGPESVPSGHRSQGQASINQDRSRSRGDHYSRL